MAGCICHPSIDPKTYVPVVLFKSTVAAAQRRYLAISSSVHQLGNVSLAFLHHAGGVNPMLIDHNLRSGAALGEAA